MKLLPHYTADGQTQVGDMIITPAEVATIKCLDSKPTLAQVFMRQDRIPPFYVEKQSLFDLLMPMTFQEKLSRTFNTALTAEESLSGGATKEALLVRLSASDATPSKYVRTVGDLALVEGKQAQLIIQFLNFSGNPGLQIKLGGDTLNYTPAEWAAARELQGGNMTFFLDVSDATSQLEISLTGATVASEFVIGGYTLSEVIQTPLKSFEMKTLDGLSSIGTLYLGPNYGQGIYDEAVVGTRQKAGSTVSQVYFLHGGQQGVFIDTTVINDFILTFTTID